ncbi:MAG: hypothetical protein IK104_05300 [Clostridia bacterium]|nr:hypothetical protein [Clostridia bacterium]
MQGEKLHRKKPLCGLLPTMPDETLRPGRMRIATDGEKEAMKHVYRREGTVNDFRRAYILGDGDFGAAIHGKPDNYTYHVAKNDLWWDDYDSDPPCYLPGGIERLRERILEGDPTLKQDMFAAANCRNNEPCQTSAARLTLHLCAGGVFSHIRERMDLHAELVEQTYCVGNQNGVVCGDGFSTLSCISPAEEVMVIVCSAGERAGHMGKLALELTKDPMEVSANSGPKTAPEIAALEKEIETYYTPVPYIEDGDFGFTMRLRAGRDPENSPNTFYTVRMRTSAPEIIPCAAGSRIVAEGRPAGKSVVFLLTVVSSYDAPDPKAEAKRRLDRVTAEHMPVSVGATIDWYRHIWRRSWIRLPDTKLSRPWYWSEYQALCARKPGKFAAGYLAPWYQSTFANWGHHILTYEQAKTNLGLLPTNHAELLEPWFRLLKDSREKLQKFTRDYYGMRGTAYPHAISCTGTVIASAINLNGTQMNLQTTGESVKFCWDYYDYTGDETFLRETGYPLMKDAALFYHDYLLTAENGERYIFPSRSQEFVATIGFANEFMTNSLIDLCMTRHTLSRAAEAARILGVDEDLAEAWENDVAAMRKDYAVWPDGTWKTAEDTDDLTFDYGPPCVTDVAPVAYTGEVDAWHGESEALIEAAKKTVKKHVPDNEIPWDQSFGILSRLRMGDAAYAGRILKLIPEEYECGGNLEAPIAFDCNISVGKGTAATAEVITEMLLQSQGGVIRVFPAWDFTLGDAAFWSLRARGAFLVGAESRGGEVAYVIVRSIKGNPCRVAAALGDTVRVRDLETQALITFTRREDGVICFDTEASHEYVLERAEQPLESFPIIN